MFTKYTRHNGEAYEEVQELRRIEREKRGSEDTLEATGRMFVEAKSCDVTMRRRTEGRVSQLFVSGNRGR